MVLKRVLIFLIQLTLSRTTLLAQQFVQNSASTQGTDRVGWRGTSGTSCTVFGNLVCTRTKLAAVPLNNSHRSLRV
jgi:hypothetical protein